MLQSFITHLEMFSFLSASIPLIHLHLFPLQCLLSSLYQMSSCRQRAGTAYRCAREGTATERHPLAASTDLRQHLHMTGWQVCAHYHARCGSLQFTRSLAKCDSILSATNLEWFEWKKKKKNIFNIIIISWRWDWASETATPCNRVCIFSSKSTDWV